MASARRRTVRRLASCLLTPVALAGSVLAASPADAASGEVYVALGDSMASGPLIPDFTGPLACGRSTHNYAHELTKTLGEGTVLRDATCSGADTGDMTQPQDLSVLGVPAGQAPPQFDALGADATLVTLTIGGNDTGLVGIAEDCAQLDPTADPCKDTYTSGGVDQIAQRIAAFGPKLAAVLDEIHSRSPQARVLVTGYGLYIKPGGCWPVQPVLPVDADYLQGSVNGLNAEIAAQAAAHGATYVDVATPSAGHDTCQAPADRWIEGFVPTDLAAPLHPNKRGEAAYAQIVAGRLQDS